MKPLHGLLMLVTTLLWGLNLVATRFVVNELPPVFASAVRFLIVLMLVFPYLRLVPGKMKMLLTAALFTGALQFGFSYYGISLAEDMSSVAVATLTYVPFGTILAVIFLGERLGWRRIGGLALAFGGVMILSFDPRAFNYIEGLLIIMAGAFLFAVGTLFVRRLQDVHPMTLLAWMAALGVPVSLALSGVMETGQWDRFTSAGTLAHASLFYSAAFASAVGQGTLYFLLQRYPVSLITPLTLMGPVFGIGFALWILSEPVTGRMLAGAATTILGVLIITLRTPRQPVAVPLTGVEEAVDQEDSADRDVD